MEVKSLSFGCLLIIILQGHGSLHLQLPIPHLYLGLFLPRLYPGLFCCHQAMEVKSLTFSCLLMVILPGHGSLHLQPHLPHLYLGLFGRHSHGSEVFDLQLGTSW